MATMSSSSLSSSFLLLLVVGVSATVVMADNLQEACNKTLFPKVCIQSMTTNPESRTASARRLAELSVYVAKEVGTAVAAFAHHELNGVKEDVLFRCLDGCSDDIEEAVAHLSALTRELTDAKFLEVKSWLSATLGGTSTCEDGCRDAPISDVKNAVVTKSLEFEKLLRVTLDLITDASGSMSSVAVPPTAWTGSAAAPGSYGGTASAPGSYSASDAPASTTADAPSPTSSESSGPSSSSATSNGPSSSSAASSGPSSSDGPSPSSASSGPSSADAPSPSYGSSGTSSADGPSPSSGSSGPSADAPSPSYGSSSGDDAPSPSIADVPSPSPSTADAPSDGDDAPAPSTDASSPDSA